MPQPLVYRITKHFSKRMKRIPKMAPEIMAQKEIFLMIISIPNG
jgi:hypothetical protein